MTPYCVSGVKGRATNQDQGCGSDQHAQRHAPRPEERVDVYAAAVRGLSTLEPNPERQLKYADFVDIYSALDDNERQRYETEYPQEARAVSSYFQQARQEGRQEGEQRGVQKGEALVLLRLKFGEVPDEICRRIEAADADTLLPWSERILTAERIEDIFP